MVAAVALAGAILLTSSARTAAQSSAKPDFSDSPTLKAIGHLPSPTPTGAPATKPAATAAADDGPTPTKSPTSKPTSKPATKPDAETLAARKALARGMDLLDRKKSLEARAELSAALLSGKLTSDEETKAVAALTDLADATLLSDKLIDGDGFAFSYKFAKGDTLDGVLSKEKSFISSTLTAKINKIANPRKIAEGQQVKLLRGPAHAIVSKSGFTLDLFLQNDAGEKAFLKRFKVSLGKDGCTPSGAWVVSAKAVHALWTPPASAGETAKTIAWGKPGYPLGKEGYWIALLGTDENTQKGQSYGIHGTNEPESIGKAASLGCIRMLDDDIDFVYQVLLERGSTVTVRP